MLQHMLISLVDTDEDNINIQSPTMGIVLLVLIYYITLLL